MFNKIVSSATIQPIHELYVPAQLQHLSADIRVLVDKEYSSAGRYYHTKIHVQEMLVHYQQVHHLLERPLEVYLAIIFHDMVYVPNNQDNEMQSVKYAMTFIAAYGLAGLVDVDIISRLILLTATHTKIKVSLTSDEKLFIDMDMAILGTSWERFLEYDREVEQEYRAYYNERQYLFGRSGFFRSICPDMDKRIFCSDHFYERYEEIAKANVGQIKEILMRRSIAMTQRLF